MKKLLSLVLIITASFGLISCSGQKTKIQGMNISYEKVNKLFDEHYGLVEGYNIVVYVALTSGMLTPTVNSMKKSGNTLNVQIDALEKGDYLTHDMAYWKITIHSNELYVKDIKNIKVLVVTKRNQ